MASYKQKTDHTSMEVGQNKSTDTRGPLKHPSITGKQHIITFVNTASRFCIAVPVKCRCDASQITSFTLQTISSHFNRYQKRFHFDIAKEFLCFIVKSFLDSRGIRKSSTVPHCPQSNSIAEQLEHTIKNTARA